MKVDIYTTSNKYDIIYADPPWSYKDSGCQGAAAKQYNTMTQEELYSLPIQRICNKDAVLFMWVTYPKLQEALDTIRAWGFKYKSIGFQWVKLNKKADTYTLMMEVAKGASVEDAMFKQCFYGLGRWTRGNTEMCVIATKGKISRAVANVPQLIFAPIGRHSAKPAVVRDRIKQLMGNRPAIELFAREHADHWDCWGNEV